MKTGKIIAALDIGSSKITTIITQAQGTELEVLGVSTVPSKGVKKGVIVNLDEAINAIAQSIAAAERMSDVTITNLVVNVSGKLIKSLNNKGVVSVSDEITAEDVWRAADTAQAFAIPKEEEILHIINREFIIDNQSGIRQPVGMSGNRLEIDVHLILIPTTIRKNIEKSIQQLSISVDSIVFSGWADTFSVLNETEKELGVTLLDIGAGTTDIVIFKDGAVAYSGCIPVGGLNITNDLAVGLHISLEEAETLKLRYQEFINNTVKKSIIKENIDQPSFQKKEEIKLKNESLHKKEIQDELDISALNIAGLPTVSKELLLKIITVRVEEILELAKSEVERSGFELIMPAGIVITGGTAKLSNIINMVKSYMPSTNARIGIPQGLTGMVEEINSPEYATIQGLPRYLMQDQESLSNVKIGSQNSTSMLDKAKGWFKSLLPN